MDLNVTIATHPNGLIVMQMSHALKCYYLSQEEAVSLATALLNHAECIKHEEVVG